MGRFHDLWASGRFMTGNREKTDREQKTHQPAANLPDLPPEFAVSDVQRQILAALGARRGQETGRWLQSLVPESNQGNQHAAPARETSGTSAFDEIRALIDRLFKEFAELSFEFNKSAVGTNLLIAYEPPQLSEKKSDDLWYRPVEKTYHGRLTTREWALLIRGANGKISIFLIPAPMLLAYTLGEHSDVAPFMELSHAGPAQWTIGGEVVPGATVTSLAKELLGDLVRVSSGAMSENELFSPHTDHLSLGNNLAVGFVQETAAEEAQQQAGAGMDMHQACDIVDQIIDQELQSLYAKARSATPGTAQTEMLRKQISAVENFRIKMLDAFEEYTHITQSLEGTTEPAKSQV